MNETSLDHYAIVQETLAGGRAADELTSASLEILAGRLEQVRQLGGRFLEVEFSPDAKALRSRRKTVAVG